MFDSVKDLFSFCRRSPQIEEDTDQRMNEIPDDPLEDLRYYLPPSSPPIPIDSRIYLSAIHPIIVQPPINHRKVIHSIIRSGAHAPRQLTHLDRCPESDAPLPLPSNPNGPMVYVISNGILTSPEPAPPPRYHTPAPGRAIRSQIDTRGPPGYSTNPPSRVGAETAEPPPYPEIPEVPAYPEGGDGTMTAPTLQREPSIHRRERQ